MQIKTKCYGGKGALRLMFRRSFHFVGADVVVYATILGPNSYLPMNWMTVSPLDGALK